MKRSFLSAVSVLFIIFIAAPAYAQSVSVSIQNVTPGTTLSAGTTVTFQVIAAGFTNPTYTLTDSFSGSSITNSDITSGGVFTWTPQSGDQGTHNVTVSVSDAYGHAGSVSVQFTIASAYVTLAAPSPSANVPSGTAVSFYASVTGFSAPSFAVSDNFNGSSVKSSDINSGGFFSWTPTASDVGTHTITILAFDSSGHSASASSVINVAAGTSVAINDVSPGSTVAPGALVTFEASAANFSNPNFTITDSFSGTTLQSGDISTSGDFSWTPELSDVGTHTLTVTAYDTEGHTGTTQTTIVVSPSGSITNVPLTTTDTSSTAPVAPAYIFTEYLSPGSEDNEVMMLQELLQREGFLTAAPTGYFGVATEDAVEEFQQAHGIDVLGVVGPSTRDALNQIEESLAGTQTTATIPTTSTTATTNSAVSAQLESELTTVENLLQQIQSEITKMQEGQ